MKPAVESFWENRGQASRKLVWMALLAILGTETVWSGTKEWTGLGPEGKTVEALAIVPQDPSPLYAGTNGGEVFKSTDGGASWTQANSGRANTAVLSLVIEPHNPSTVYAGTGRGLFKCTDQGNSTVQALAIDSQNPNTVYAGTEGGIFKTMDGGASWSEINSGLTTTEIRSLAVDPRDPNRLYAGSSEGGVFEITFVP